MHNGEMGRIRRLWFPNVEEFVSKNDREYSLIVKTKIFHIAHRFLPCLGPGDALITPRALDEAFCAYYSRISNLGTPAEWVVKATPCSEPYALGKSVLNDELALKQIKKMIASESWDMEPYMQSEDALDLSETLALPSAKTPAALVRGGRVADFNNKAWFKNHAKGLGIRAVPGYVADSEASLKNAIRRAAREFGNDLMLRKAVHGGGLGNLRGDCEKLLLRVPVWYSMGEVLIEPYLQVQAVVGSLTFITESGSAYLGADVQIFEDGKWCGFDFPHPRGKIADSIREDALRASESAFKTGLRGYMNLDWAITAEAPGHALVLECNFRHNGFSFLLEFAKRYFNRPPSGLFIRYCESIPCAANHTDQLIDGLSRIRMDDRPVLITGPGAKEGALIVMPPSRNRFAAAIFSPERAYVHSVSSRLSQLCV